MCVCVCVYIKLNHFAVYLKHNIVNQLQFVLIAAIGMVKKKKTSLRASLVVQWLRLCISTSSWSCL